MSEKHWTERWPGRWSMKATFQTPAGNRIDIESPLAAAEAKEFIERVLDPADKDERCVCGATASDEYSSHTNPKCPHYAT